MSMNQNASFPHNGAYAPTHTTSLATGVGEVSMASQPELDAITRALHVYVNPTITVLGVIGNLLAFVIFLPRARKCSTFTYLCPLAIIDSVYLVFTETFWLLKTGFDFNVFVRLDCNFILFFSYFTSQLAAWTLVATSIERVIVTLMPLKARHFVSVRKASAALVVMATALVAFNFHYFGGMRQISDGGVFYYEGRCEGRLAAITWYDQVLYPWLDSVLYSLLPSTLILVCNALVIRRLRRQRQRAPRSNQERARTAKRVTILCVLLTSIFVLLTLPSALLLVVYRTLAAGWEPRRQAVLFTAGHVAHSVSILNHAVNIIVYLVFSTRFRRDLRKLVKIDLCIEVRAV